MRRVYFKNGFVFLSNFPEEDLPDWITTDYDTGNPYFLPNRYTCKLFKQVFLPQINSIAIDESLLKTLCAWPLTPYAKEGIPMIDIVEPDGITLKAYQRDAVRIMLRNLSFGFFFGTGTGKTLIAISFLLNSPLNKVIILMPKNVIGQYKDECEKYLQDYTITTDIQEYVNTDQCVLLINYQQSHNLITKVKKPIDALILDESHNVKDFSSKANAECKKLAKLAYRKYLFTGTPQDKSRHDIFPQLSILNPKYMPFKSRFLHRYFILDDYYQPRREIKHMSDELTSMIKEITWGITTEEALGGKNPHQNIKDIIVECPHPGSLYHRLIRDRVIEKGNFTVIANTKAKLKTKLRLLCSGHIYGDYAETVVENGEVKEVKKLLKIPLKQKPKLERFARLIKDIDRAIIFTVFSEDSVDIMRALKENNRSCINVTGTTTKNDERIKAFKEKKVDFLVSQARSGNAGLDITNVHNVIFYTLHESYIVYHQCRSRIRAIGQTNPCRFYHLICTRTVEEQIYQALKNKKSFSTKLFKIYN